MTVFVVHPVREDISPALKFGSFRFITERYVYGDELEWTIRRPRLSVLDCGPNNSPPTAIDNMSRDLIIPTETVARLARAAREFNYEHDFLLIAGDHLQFAQFVVFLGILCPDFKVLRYDRKIDDYLPVRLDGMGSTLLSFRPNIGDQHGQDRDQSLDPDLRSLVARDKARKGGGDSGT